MAEQAASNGANGSVLAGLRQSGKKLRQDSETERIKGSSEGTESNTRVKKEDEDSS